MGMFLGAWADYHTRFLPMLLPSVGNIANGIVLLFALSYPASPWQYTLIGAYVLKHLFYTFVQGGLKFAFLERLLH